MTPRRTLSIIADITGVVLDMDKAGASIAPILSDRRPRCRVSDRRRQISFLRIFRGEPGRRRTGDQGHGRKVNRDTHVDCGWALKGKNKVRDGNGAIANTRGACAPQKIHAGTSRTLPFFQTTGDKPSCRFSARTLRATRLNARSARATKACGFFAPFGCRFLFILRSIAGLNLYHRSQKSRAVLREDPGCPKAPNAERAASNHQLGG